MDQARVLEVMKAGGELTLFRHQGSNEYHFELNLSTLGFDPVVVDKGIVHSLLEQGLIRIDVQKLRWMTYVLAPAPGEPNGQG